MLFIVVLAPSLRIMVEQQQQLARCTIGRGAEAEGEGPVGERARWDDPSYVDAQARERLNFVYPGEYSYLVIDDTSIPTTGNGQPISAEIQTTQVDWVSTLLSSVLTAGLTDAAPGQIVAPAITGSK